MTPELAIELIGAGPVKIFVYPAQNLKLDVEVIINNYDHDYKNQFPKSCCCTITISIARKMQWLLVLIICYIISSLS